MAVRKAIASGRIVLEPDGTIDPIKADAAWAASSDPASRPVQPKVSAQANGPGAGDSNDLPAGNNYARVRTVGEALKAEERRIRLDVLKGQLVDRARAVATVFGLARRERDAWLNWPPRVAALMATELSVDPHTMRVDPHSMETVLMKHVREHFAELYDIFIELRRVL